MSHDELVERARIWLANSMKCSVVITEMAYSYGEIPDAIGWNGSLSILVECKTSKSDFKADFNKSSRRVPEYLAIGNKRFYLVPPSLLEFAKKNLLDNWGLLIAYKNRVETKVEAEYHDAKKGKEISLLISTIRRIAGIKEPLYGMNVRCYTIDKEYGNPKASLSIEPIMELDDAT